MTHMDPRPRPRLHAAAAFCGGVLLSLPVLIGLWPIFPVVTLGLAVAAIVALATRRTWWRPIVFMGGWLALPALLFGMLFWVSGGSDYVLARSFDREAWVEKRGAAFGDRTRLRMVDDLQRSGRLDGLARERALELLGPPDDGVWWGNDGRSPVWRLGPDRGFGVDSSWLRLTFGPDGRVVDHDIVED